MSAPDDRPATTPRSGPGAETIPELLAWRAAHDAERVFLVVDDRPVAFGDLDRLAAHVAAGLGDWEVRPGTGWRSPPPTVCRGRGCSPAPPGWVRRS